MVKRPRINERGIALLAVLLGIALMTLIIVNFSTAATLGYLSAANQVNELRAEYLARSAVAVGLGLLAQDTLIDSQTKQAYDSLTDVWAVPFPPVPVDGGVVSLSIVDAARKLDINELVNPSNGAVNQDFEARMVRLFQILNVDPSIIPAIVDWIDPDSIDSPGGAEMDYYMRLIPPYAPRNAPMPTIGDLKMVKGVNDAIFNRLRPYLTVMPEMLVNVNTASPEVIACLEPELTANPDLVKQIVMARTARPFTNITDVLNLPGLGTFGQRLSKVLTTKSVYFTINGMGTFAGARKLVHVTVHRQTNQTAMLASWQED
jgi:general secretion pathway protein K